MSNYAEGTLRVRGKFENLKKFIETSFTGVTLIKLDGSDGSRHRPRYNGMVKFKIGEGLKKADQDVYLNGSEGAYGEFPGSYFAPNAADADVFSVYFRLRQAWAVDGDFIVNLAKSFCLDMAIDAYEKGCETETHVKVVGGEVLVNYSAQHKYLDWNFDVPNPEYGC